MMSIKQRQRDRETKSYTYKEAQRERNKFAVQNANVKRPMDGPTDKIIYWNTCPMVENAVLWRLGKFWYV